MTDKLRLASEEDIESVKRIYPIGGDTYRVADTARIGLEAIALLRDASFGKDWWDARDALIARLDGAGAEEGK